MFPTSGIMPKCLRVPLVCLMSSSARVRVHARRKPRRLSRSGATRRGGASRRRSRPRSRPDSRGARRGFVLFARPALPFCCRSLAYCQGAQKLFRHNAVAYTKNFLLLPLTVPIFCAGFFVPKATQKVNRLFGLLSGFRV